MTLNYVKAEKLSLKDHPEFSEEWLKQRIIDDPQILGLGEVDVKDIERPQPNAGRLDLLLQDTDAEKWYEVELMLGRVNESHIIRCIEYWDIERKRYPQYDHVAVLVAEEITTRFLNVIGLFNNTIPLIAIQLSALKVDGTIILSFTKVLDEIIPGEFEGGIDNLPVDRRYWEERGAKETVAIADTCLKIMKEFNASLDLKFNQGFIGVIDQGRPKNFVSFRPRNNYTTVDAGIQDKPSWGKKLKDAGIDVRKDKDSDERLVFRLQKSDAEKHHDLLKELFQVCYKEWIETAA